MIPDKLSSYDSCRSSSEGGDIAAIRDVFGDSDDEDVPAEYEVQNEVQCISL